MQMIARWQDRHRGGRRFRGPGFSLVELLGVVAILAVLLALSVPLFGRGEGRALATGAGQLAAAVERGRAAALRSGRPVLLAWSDPRDGLFGDEVSRVGLFELDEVSVAGVAKGRLLERWQPLPAGLGFVGGSVGGLSNARDADPLKLRWRGGERSAEFRGLVFGARGGLRRPRGSGPVVLRLSQLRDGRRVADAATRNLRIGRAVARPWHLDE